jgi:hypothetical protein
MNSTAKNTQIIDPVSKSYPREYDLASLDVGRCVIGADVAILVSCAVVER